MVVLRRGNCYHHVGYRAGGGGGGGGEGGLDLQDTHPQPLDPPLG